MHGSLPCDLGAVPQIIDIMDVIISSGQPSDPFKLHQGKHVISFSTGKVECGSPLWCLFECIEECGRNAEPLPRATG